jgi:hypothetical protein
VYWQSPLVVVGLLVAFTAPLRAERLPDEPAPRAEAPSRPTDAPSTYVDALRIWKSPEDVSGFIGATFVYDRARALALAESARADGRRVDIIAPDGLYVDPRGVCVDLARFGVETLNRLDGSYEARYVMLEFEPVVIEGRTLRRHWIATFRRDGKIWFFADSRRPGYIAGPYDSVDAFIEDYARYRERPIVKWRETVSFLRATRAVARSSQSTKDDKN